MPIASCHAAAGVVISVQIAPVDLISAAGVDAAAVLLHRWCMIAAVHRNVILKLCAFLPVRAQKASLLMPNPVQASMRDVQSGPCIICSCMALL